MSTGNSDSSEIKAAPKSETSDSNGSPSVFGLGDVARKMFSNTFRLAIGWNVNSLLRLVVAGLIVRGFGVGVFGEYVVIIALLAIADWVLDFGTNDVFVREVAKAPDKFAAKLRVLVGLKLLQLPVSILAMVVMLLAMNQEAHVVQAGLLAATGLVFFLGVVAYRAVFKATLTMGNEIGSEFVSIFVLIGLIALVWYLDGGLLGLIAAHLLARAVFFSGCFYLGHKRYPLSIRGVSSGDLRSAMKASWLIGFIGLLAVVNNMIGIAMLSVLATLTDAAYFSAAQKLAWPVLAVLTSVGMSFYPVLSSLWPHSRAEFFGACQRALDTSLILGALAIAGIFPAANFIMGLLGPQLVGGANALQIIVIMCVAKAVGLVVGPVLFIIHEQKIGFLIVAISLLLKVAGIALVAPSYGYVGVAYVSLAVELLFLAPITLWILKQKSGFAFRWRTSAKLFVFVTLAIYLAGIALPSGSLKTGVLSAAIYTILVVLFRVVRLSELTDLLRKRQI